MPAPNNVELKTPLVPSMIFQENTHNRYEVQKGKVNKTNHNILFFFT